MNDTKKITQGAMLLAIVGAAILIDRMTAFFFSEIVILLVPVVIIIYTSLYSMKDGIVLSLCLMILSFLIGNFSLTYLIYMPAGVIAALVYSFGIKKGFDKSGLLFLVIICFVLAEILATYIIYPLIGFPVSQMIDELSKMFSDSLSKANPNFEMVLAQGGFNLSSFLIIIYLFSTILIGVLEAVLTHLLAVILLKRFKIKDLGQFNFWNVKPKPVLAYLSFLPIFISIIIKPFSNEIVYYICISTALFGTCVLLYYGYIFLNLYSFVVKNKRLNPFLVLLLFIFPFLLLPVIILGFLYGSGPLRTYLEKKLENKNQ